MFQFHILCAKVTMFNEVTKATAVVYVPVGETVVTEDLLLKAEAVSPCVAIRVEFCTLYFMGTPTNIPDHPEMIGNRLRLSSGELVRWSNEEDLDEAYFPGAEVLTQEQLEADPTRENQAILALMREQKTDEAIRSVDGTLHPKASNFHISNASLVA